MAKHPTSRGSTWDRTPFGRRVLSPERTYFVISGPSHPELSTMLAPYADQLAAVAGTLGGSLAHYLGMLAGTLSRFDEAEAYFATAAGTHDRIKAPAWLARTRLEWGRMLLTRRRSGDTERARDFLGQALTTARELGLGNVERRAVALLQEA